MEHSDIMCGPYNYNTEMIKNVYIYFPVDDKTYYVDKQFENNIIEFDGDDITEEMYDYKPYIMYMVWDAYVLKYNTYFVNDVHKMRNILQTSIGFTNGTPDSNFIFKNTDLSSVEHIIIAENSPQDNKEFFANYPNKKKLRKIDLCDATDIMTSLEEYQLDVLSVIHCEQIDKVCFKNISELNIPYKNLWIGTNYPRYISFECNNYHCSGSGSRTFVVIIENVQHSGPKSARK